MYRKFPEEMQDKATSLAMESGQEYDRNQIIGLVMKHFEEDYERFIQTCDFENLLEEQLNLKEELYNALFVAGTGAVFGRSMCTEVFSTAITDFIRIVIIMTGGRNCLLFNKNFTAN